MPVALRRDRLKAAENSTPSAVLRSPKNIASYTRGYKSAIAAALSAVAAASGRSAA